MAEVPTPEERANRSYASHTTMTTTYCALLSRLVQEVRESSNDTEVREKTFIAHLVAIAAIETFYNAYFQVLVEEKPALQQHKEGFYSDIRKRIGITAKVENWPRNILGKNYDASDPAIIAYKKLVDTRNQLTHFKSTYSTLSLPGKKTISGFADITTYNQLSLIDAKNALSTVKSMVEYVLKASGHADENLPSQFFRWTMLHPDLD